MNKAKFFVNVSNLLQNCRPSDHVDETIWNNDWYEKTLCADCYDSMKCNELPIGLKIIIIAYCPSGGPLALYVQYFLISVWCCPISAWDFN